MPTVLLSLPPETLASIATWLDLLSLISVSQSCRSWKRVCVDLEPAQTVVQRMLKAWPQDDRQTQALATLGRREGLAGEATFKRILTSTQRSFVINWLELPILPPRVWQNVFEARFAPDTVQRAKDDTSVTWRAKYWNEIRSLEHRYKTNCTRTQSKVSYLVIRRHGRVTTNRISPAQMNPETMFARMRQEANVASLPHAIAHYRPKPDLLCEIYYTAAARPIDHYMVNELATSLIRHVPGVSPIPLEGDLQVLGPCLIICRIADVELRGGSQSEAFHDAAFDTLAEAYPFLRPLVPNGPEKHMGYA